MLADPGVVAPVADGAAGLGAVLAANGGWGIAGLLCLVVWKLYKAAAEKDQQIFKLLDKQNEILQAIQRLGGRS